VDFISVGGLDDVILVGHSYGGIVITGVADRLDSRLRRLVYLSAFVANNGESLSDLVPPHYPALLTALGDGSVVLPFQIWRDAYINDADLETAQRAYRSVEPAAAQDIYRQDCAAQESGRDDTAEVLHQLYGGHSTSP
jgi:pimeloyl-ACP methyl ester carboxylesterase